MKVVLFCGGQGIRLREVSDTIPKPMALVGPRPILWHGMRYYAHFGHKEFILCLGYKGDVIKDYFLHYEEATSNDFVLAEGGRKLELLRTDIQDWRITFAFTGMHANIGERLLAVRGHLGSDELFLANYGDNVTDAPLPELIDDFERRGKIAAFLAVRPTYTFHVVSTDVDGLVTSLDDVHRSNLRINGGIFIFRREIFDYIRDGEELVEQPFRRLIEVGGLIAYDYDGFWAPMDTLKDMQVLQALFESGRPPWAVWEAPAESRVGTLRGRPGADSRC